MKIGGIQKFSLSDFPGCCSAIIFTIGCNFRCSYCHNKELWDENGESISCDEVMDFLRSMQNKLDGVVITGGEPTIHAGLIDFIEKVRGLDYKIKLNTNGANPDCLRKLLESNMLDYISMDIKAPLHIYESLCGVSVPLEYIKESISLISSSKVPHEFRTAFSKEWLNDADIEAIKEMIPKESKHIVQNCV